MIGLVIEITPETDKIAEIYAHAPAQKYRWRKNYNINFAIRPISGFLILMAFRSLYFRSRIDEYRIPASKLSGW